MRRTIVTRVIATFALIAASIVGARAELELKDPVKEGQTLVQTECDALFALVDLRAVGEREAEALGRIDALEAKLKADMEALVKLALENYNIVNGKIVEEVEATAKAVENLSKAGQKLKFDNPDKSLLEKAKAGISGVASGISGGADTAKSLSLGDKRREAEETLQFVRFLHARNAAALKAVASHRDKIKDCAKQQREKLLPPLPPPTAGATNRFAGNWQMTCDAGSPTKFDVSGQFVFDVMPPNTVFTPLKGTLVGGGMAAVAMDGMIWPGGGMSATPPENAETNFTFTGTLNQADGVYAASGDVLANYKGASACTGKFST